jgi:hypothetical protein
MKTNTKRTRLTGKSKARMPLPFVKAKKDDGFSLRVIDEADGRYSLVKRLKMRLATLIEDAGIDSIQGEMLAGRCVFLCAYLETLETNCMEGKKIDMGRYAQTVNALNGTLNKLGIQKQVKKDMTTLEAYVSSNSKKKRKVN